MLNIFQSANAEHARCKSTIHPTLAVAMRALDHSSGGFELMRAKDDYDAGESRIKNQIKNIAQSTWTQPIDHP
jgi:hypothetical protein